MIPSHVPIETDVNDKLTPYLKNGGDDNSTPDESSDRDVPGQYKIVETIYDNDDDNHLDLK